MRHPQLRKHEGLILQMVLLCIVASCENHKYEEVFGMDLLQLEYFQYKSVKTLEIHIVRETGSPNKHNPRNGGNFTTFPK